MSLTGRPFLRRGPSGPLSPKFGLVQVGYDQPFKTQSLPTSGATTVIPRDVALKPLQVQLPDVTPGNTLEVDFNLHLLNGASGINFTAIAVVSFNGNVVLAPASGWFAINNGNAGLPIQPGTIALVRGLVAVVIPDDATTATVQLYYITDVDGLIIGGTDLTQIPGSTLKVSEIAALSVPQPGPSNLIAF